VGEKERDDDADLRAIGLRPYSEALLSSEQLESELTKWLANERFVTAAFAAVEGFGDRREHMRRVFPPNGNLPPEVPVEHWMQLVAEAVKRVRAGQIRLPDQLRRKYREFFAGSKGGA
jgi:hypothetical protein